MHWVWSSTAEHQYKSLVENDLRYLHVCNSSWVLHNKSAVSMQERTAAQRNIASCQEDSLWHKSWNDCGRENQHFKASGSIAAILVVTNAKTLARTGFFLHLCKHIDCSRFSKTAEIKYSIQSLLALKIGCATIIKRCAENLKKPLSPT